VLFNLRQHCGKTTEQWEGKGEVYISAIVFVLLWTDLSDGCHGNWILRSARAVTGTCALLLTLASCMWLPPQLIPGDNSVTEAAMNSSVLLPSERSTSVQFPPRAPSLKLLRNN
jgi:hypothetical protein